MPAQVGPPSEYTKSKRPLFLAMLVAQTVVCIMRMVMLLDIIGGFIMAICIGLGWYAWKEDMNITFICYWGMMCAFNGIFDLVKLIDQWVKSPMPLFTSKLPASYNVASGVLVAVPATMILGAWLAYNFYSHFSVDTDGIGASSYPGGFNRYGRGDERQPINGHGNEQGFRAFAGGGQRLGSV